jgi:hypothetical protein
VGRKALAAAMAAALLRAGHAPASWPPADPICVDTDPLVVVGQPVLPAVHRCSPVVVPPPIAP